MSDSKLVELSYGDWWQAKLKITYNKNTLQWMEDQVLFWTGGAQLIADNDGDIEKTYLQKLIALMLELSMEYNAYGVKKEIEGMEGWAALDKNFGIELLSIDDWEFSIEDMDIKVIT